MSSDPKKTVTTVQKPDGTMVTTTTTTLHKEYDDGFEGSTFYYDDGGPVQVRYCCTLPGILRILEIICGFIIVGCTCYQFGSGPFQARLGGVTFVLVATCICVCITFLFLILFFFGFHLNILRGVQWRIVDLVFSIVAVIVFLIAGALMIYYSTGDWVPNCDFIIIDGRREDCSSIGCWIAAAVFCFINVILYALSAFFALDGRYYDQI